MHSALVVLNVHIVMDEHVPAASQALVQGIGADLNSEASTADAQDTANEPVAVIGMGAILPGARTIDALWKLIRSGEDRRIEAPEERWAAGSGMDDGNPYWKVFHVIGWVHHRFRIRLEETQSTAQTGRERGSTAIHATRCSRSSLTRTLVSMDKDYDKTRTGVIVGTIFGAEFGNQLQMGLRLPEFKKTLHQVLQQHGVPAEHLERIAEEYEKVLLKHMPALVDETGSFTASTLASRITKTFDLMGGAVAVDAGNASGMAALSGCMDLLRAGDCDIMVCAAGHRAMDYASYNTMAQSGFLALDDPAVPFDANASGPIPGEGVGVVVLKRLSDAQRDGDRIHGIIQGVGVSRSENEDASLRNAIQNALTTSDVQPAEVRVIETGGTGIPRIDRHEFESIIEAYATPVNAATETTALAQRHLGFGSFSGQIGNTGGTSGMASLMKAICELNHAEMPNLVGMNQPADYFQQHADQFLNIAETNPLVGTPGDGRLLAGVDCFSQYETAYHVLVEGMTRVPAPMTNPVEPIQAVAKPITLQHDEPVDFGPVKIVRIGGNSWDDLAAKVNAIDVAAYTHSAQAAILNAEPFAANDRFRLAIVGESVEDITSKLTLAEKQLANPAARPLLAEKGIFVNEVTEQPRTAFLFPGQGSQYDGMLQALTEEFAPAERAREQVDAVLKQMQLPSFAELAWQADDPLQNPVWRAQLSLIAANAICAAAVDSLGISADRVAGHSFGELAALTFAGSWDFESAVRATKVRCESIDQCQAGGVLLSTSAPANVMHELCEATGGNVTISHFNAPDQTVVGGEEAAIREMATRVEQAGFQARILDVPAAFHTPLMEAVKQPFGAGLTPITIMPPTIPLLSSVTNRYTADPEDIRDNLVVQLTQPLRYAQLVERLLVEGVTALVEVGPRQVLTGLNKRIVGQGSVAYVGCDHHKRPGLQQLVAVRACVETTGALDPVSNQSNLTFESVSTSTAETRNAAPVETVQTISSDTPSADKTAIGRFEGSYYDIGFQHGQMWKAEIRKVLRRYTDLAGTAWEDVIDLEAAVKKAEFYFGPDELEELRGLAAGAHVSPTNLIAHNLRLFLTGGAGGAHFALSATANADQGLLHAVNEDSRMALPVAECLQATMNLIRPENQIPFATFGTYGQVGGLNGTNETGLTVTSTVLLDTGDSDTQFPTAANGVLLTVLVQRVLSSAADIEQALSIIQSTAVCVPYTLCLSHRTTGQICYVENNLSAIQWSTPVDRIEATNHQIFSNTDAVAIPAHSQNRLQRLQELLTNQSAVAIDEAQSILNDTCDHSEPNLDQTATMNTVCRVDRHVGLIFSAQTHRVQLLSDDCKSGQRIVQEIDLHELFSSQQPTITNRVLDAIHTGQRQANLEQLVPQTDRFAQQRVPDNVGEKSDAVAQELAPLPMPNVCDRIVLDAVSRELSYEPAQARPWSRAAIILGDNPVTHALGAALEQRGVIVHAISAANEPATVVEEIKRCWNIEPAATLVVTTPFDSDQPQSLSLDSWNQRRQQGVSVPYFATQQWYQYLAQAKSLNDASLVALTAMGGDFGVSSPTESIESGALSGLVKGVGMEVRMGTPDSRFRAKVIDFARQANADSIVAAIIRELESSDPDVEVGYRINGERVVLRPKKTNADDLTPLQIRQGATVVVTGGARGVTAVVARELGRKFGFKLHLIGSSPLPEIPDTYHTLSADEMKEVRATLTKEALANGEKPIDAWSRFEKALEIDRTLREFAAEGLQTTYHACDVSDRTALQNILTQIRAVDGPIEGIVHGAGFERACRFEKKQPELVERTLGAKVDGAAALMELTANDPVAFCVLFGSVSGRHGGVGQTDYCTANDMLAKLTGWYRQHRPNCTTACFHWHAWDDVGMAVRPESQHIRKLHDIKFMPSLEGAAHLIRDIQTGLTTAEVVITEWQAYANLVPAEETVAAPAISSTVAPPSNKLPLIDNIVTLAPQQELVAEVHFDPVADIFLAQHRFRKRPMLPAVVGLESLIEAASLLVGEGEQIVSVSDVQIHNGLRFHTDESQIANISAKRAGEIVACRLSADLRNRQGHVLETDRDCLTASVSLNAAQPVLNIPMPPAQGEWFETWYPNEEIVIYHGEPFRCLGEMAASDADKMAWCKLQSRTFGELPGRRGGAGWNTPSALLDACFFACGLALWFMVPGVVAIPHGIRKLTLGSKPRDGEECLVHLTFRGRDENVAVFDFVMYGDDGRVLMAVEGYQNVIVVGEVATVDS